MRAFVEGAGDLAAAEARLAGLGGESLGAALSQALRAAEGRLEPAPKPAARRTREPHPTQVGPPLHRAGLVSRSFHVDGGGACFQGDLELAELAGGGLHASISGDVSAPAAVPEDSTSRALAFRVYESELARALGGLELVARPEGVVYEVARLHAELARSAAELEERGRMLRAVASLQTELIRGRLGYQGTLDLVCGRAQELTGADGAGVMVRDGRHLVYRAASGTSAGYLGVRLPMRGSLSGESLRASATLRSGDVDADPRVDNGKGPLLPGLRSVVTAPLLDGTQVVGVIKLDSPRPGAFDEEDEWKLQLIAGFIGASIERARHLALREELRESQERLAALVAATPVLLIGLDLGGSIALAAGRGLDGFGVKAGDLVGLSAWDFIGAAPQAGDALRRAYAGEQVQTFFEARGRRLEAQLSPVHDAAGKVAGVMAVATDVTDRVATERSLEQARREGETKDRVMAIMNHEVRTPLNSILGFAELLKIERAGALNDRQKRYVGNVETAGRHLLALVSDSLDLAKLATGQMETTPVDIEVATLVEQAAGQVQPMLEARELALSIDSPGPLWVRADRRRLLQVLWNLLSNAIKHSPSGGTVSIRARPEQERVAISVIDTGPGIAPEEREHIFQEFYQVAGSPDGTGLGLAVSRQLTLLMGGELRLETEVGEGSEFSVLLPASEGGAPGEGLRPAAALGGRPPRLGD